MTDVLEITVSAGLNALALVAAVSGLFAPSVWFFATNPAVSPVNIVVFTFLSVPFLVLAAGTLRARKWWLSDNGGGRL